ncbi:MAG: PIG-L family deacetylase [Actinobacteria bacterium]|nr:PIG-L family deacetylase [Actinomycetota bacterium]
MGDFGDELAKGEGQAERRLMAVHAHPDDESITTGGLLARCARAGVQTCLLTCTDGRHGPVNPDLGLDLDPDGLALARAAELDAAARELGIQVLHRLGYHDSGIAGSPANQASRAFWSQPADDVLARVVAIIRSFRPHVLVTYDPFGCTGHPDHIAAHRTAVLAVEAAGEAGMYPAAGRPWMVSRLFYPVFPVSAMRAFIGETLEQGRPHPMRGLDAEEINYTRADETVTHWVDIGCVYERKCAALSRHRTQVGRHYPQMYRSALARREREHFRIAVDRPCPREWGDIFQPVGK